jgi:hypothetical protein
MRSETDFDVLTGKMSITRMSTELNTIERARYPQYMPYLASITCTQQGDGEEEEGHTQVEELTRRKRSLTDDSLMFRMRMGSAGT